MHKKIITITDKVKQIWNSLPDDARRVLHTFYQSFIAVFLVGVLPILTDLLQTGNLSTAKVALGALVASAISAGISAGKGVIQAKRG